MGSSSRQAPSPATSPIWDPNDPNFAGNIGFKKDDGKGGRIAITKDDVYQLKTGQWLPTAGNQDAQDAISADKLTRENDAKNLASANERLVSAQSDMALKTVSRLKPKPKGGTILTSPLGVIGNSASTGKTLIGA